MIFGWVDLLYRNFDDCIYIVAEATTVVTFAVDVTVLFSKLPCFGQFFMMKTIMFYLVIGKRNVNELYLKRVYRPLLIISHVMTQNDG